MDQKQERGALIVEASFVFPIMFLVIFVMLVTCNAYFQKCRVDSIITELSIEGAACCADPQLMTVKGGKLPSLSTNIYPYRAFSGAGAKEMKSVISNIDDDANERVSKLGTGLFSAMQARDVKIDVDYSNIVISSSFTVDASYRIMLPVRLLFEEDFFYINLATRLEMPVSNVTELIRNTDMAEDYMEQYGIADTVRGASSKIAEAIGKVKGIFKKLS